MRFQSDGFFVEILGAFEIETSPVQVSDDGQDVDQVGATGEDSFVIFDGAILVTLLVIEVGDPHEGIVVAGVEVEGLPVLFLRLGIHAEHLEAVGDAGNHENIIGAQAQVSYNFV